MSSLDCAALARRLASLYDIASSLAAMHANGVDAGWPFGENWAIQQMVHVQREIAQTEKAMHAANCPLPTSLGHGRPGAGSSSPPDPTVGPIVDPPLDPETGDPLDNYPKNDPWPDTGSTGGRFKNKL